MFKSTRERLMASTIFCGAAMAAAIAATPAAAQQGNPPPSSSPVGPTTPPGAPSVGPAATSTTPENANGQPAANTVQAVVITGSRIPQPGLTSTSPLTVVNDQEVKLSGTTNVEQLLNNMPQVFAAQSSQVANGATGTATADLRNLGSNRTLVLVDGKRLMPGDPRAPVPDLNDIPAQLVDRVDVVTGGASAVYGSDAVAGVVNFIMKKDFQGVRLDANGLFYQHDAGPNAAVDSAIAAFNTAHPGHAITAPNSVVDGGTYDFTAIIGVNSPDGKGNVTAYAEYRNLQPVTEDQYKYSACGVSTVPGPGAPAGVYNLHTCAGSSNSAYGHFKVSSLTPNGVYGGPTVTPGSVGASNATLSDNPNGTNSFVPYNAGLAYNFAPLNYFQRPDERYTAGYFAHYEVNPMFDVYSTLMFADDHTVAQIAQSGLFQGTGANGNSTVSINCNNPLLSASQAAALCGTLAGTPALTNLIAGYRFAVGGYPRQDDLRHTDYKIDLGVRGDLGSGWSYDAYLQYGTAIFAETYLNDVSMRNVQNALIVNPATGTCVTGAGSGCVPLNIFQYGGLTPAAVAYVGVPGFERGQTTEQIASASVTGDLGQYGIKSPWASDGVGVAFGTEYRREALAFRTDQEFTTGDLAGQGGPRKGNSGAFALYELYGEMRVPIVQDAPFTKSFIFDGGYRFSDYTSIGVSNTYKAQFEWAPVDDIRFRGGYNRAVRAPNVNELFTPQAVGLFGGSDPCAGPTPSASEAACARTGVTAAQYTSGSITQCPASQCTALFGGNPNLKPEKADTVTVGAVFTPHEGFLRGFTMTVDAFDIRVYGLVVAGVGGAEVTLTQCLATGAPVYCNMIHRDPATGIIFGNTGYVIATNTNTGFLKEQGIDFELNYRTRFNDWGLPDWGGLTFNLVGTYTRELVRQPVSGGGTFDCAGLYGSDKCGLPTPAWRHRFRATWTTPWSGVALSFDWRYIGHTEFDGNSSNPFLKQAVINAADAKIPAYNYFDFSGSWRIREGMVFRAGVLNIMDKDPPIVDSNVFPAAGPAVGNGNTFPGMYDSLGRTIFMGLTADF